MISRLRLSLLLLRVGVFVVMFAWTIDKFVRPQHASAIFSGFYFIDSVSTTILTGLAILELIVILAFLAGFKKRITYGAVLTLHAISTLSSYRQYFDPFEKVNLLFFAAWPMLAACTALYLLRDEDTFLTVDR